MKPYIGNKPYVFISYCHQDKEDVFNIIEKMQERGYRIWYDVGIIPKTDYYEVIAERISESKYFIAFITENYSKSDFCNKEFKYALGQRLSILPIFLEETKLNGGLSLAISDIQGVLKYECKNEKEFYDKMYSAYNLSSFLEENPQKILSEIEDALIINNCVPIKKILTAQLSDKVFPVLEKAYYHSFSHIPIMDKQGICIGVFGHSMWSKILLDKIKSGDALFNDDTIFGDLKEYLSFDNQIFEDFVFLSRESTIFDAKIKTSQAYNKRARGVGMFFITETGSPDEPLLGLLTPTGILGRKIID